MDAQKVIDNNNRFLEGVYVDLGVVLRTEDGMNHYLSEQLTKQAKDRKYEFSDSRPLVFKPGDLELIADDASSSGLGFKIRDSASPFNAPQLSYKNRERKFNTTNKNGMPILNGNGNRINYTTDNGLSGFRLGGILHLFSGFNDLVGSNYFGRIVVMDDGGKK